MPDLMAALEQSIAAAKAARATQRVRPEKGDPPSFTGEIAPPPPDGLAMVPARAGDAQLWSDVAKALRTAVDLLPQGQVIVNRLRDQQPGQPGAQAYNPDKGAQNVRTRPWCFIHQTDHVTHNDDGLTEYGDCAHTVQVAGPTDPVGDAVAKGSDKAEAALVEFRREWGYVVNAVRNLDRIAKRWGPPTIADDETRKAVILANKTSCQECAKHGVDREVYRSGDVNGNLEKPARLCSWHYGYVRTTGSMPTSAQTTAHLSDKRVYRPAS